MLFVVKVEFLIMLRNGLSNNFFKEIPMKQVIRFLLALLAWAPAVWAEKTLDFTVTDTKGTVHHLQSYLDQGKYVLVEFGYLN